MKKYKIPKLYSAGDNVSRRWFVYYSFINPESQKFVRFREYGNINKQKDLKKRHKEAEVLLQAINDLLRRGYNPFDDNSQVVSEIEHQNVKSLIESLEEVLHVKKTICRQRTWQTYRNILDHFVKWLKKSKYDKMPARLFTRKLAQEFADSLSSVDGVGNRTRNNKVTVLKAIFSSLLEREIIQVNPWIGIKKLKVNIGRNIAFSTAQQEMLKKAMSANDPELHLFVQFIYYCFIRPKELLMLQIRDFDFENQTIRIPASASKNRQTQIVLFPAPLIRTLAEMDISKYPADWYLFGKQLKPSPESILRNRVSVRHAKFIKEFNLGSDYSLYSWKHTGVVRAFQAGIHIKDLQAQLRHHSLDMVNIYLKSLGLEPSSSLRDKFPEF